MSVAAPGVGGATRSSSSPSRSPEAFGARRTGGSKGAGCGWLVTALRPPSTARRVVGRECMRDGWRARAEGTRSRVRRRVALGSGRCARSDHTSCLRCRRESRALVGQHRLGFKHDPARIAWSRGRRRGVNGLRGAAASSWIAVRSALFVPAHSTSSSSLRAARPPPGSRTSCTSVGRPRGLLPPGVARAGRARGPGV